MEKGLRNTLILSGLAGGVAVGGYFLYRSIMKAIEFEIIPQGVKVLSKDANGMKLQINMGIKNPSDMQFSLSEKEFDIYLNGIFIARLQKKEEQVIYPNAISTLFLDVDINYKDIMAKLNVATGQGLSAKIDFVTKLKQQRLRLFTKLSIKYGILPRIPIDVNTEGTLKWWGL
jgi:LEA14-like dessication related protein